MSDFTVQGVSLYSVGARSRDRFLSRDCHVSKDGCNDEPGSSKPAWFSLDLE